jgi:antitoxin component YwqK of YwqJK toxin-antitoxin module
MRKLLRVLAFSLLVASLFTGAVAWAEGTYGDAIKAYIAKDYATAFKLLVPLADDNNGKALFSLAQLYYNGNGVSQNVSTAYALFSLAKARDSQRAQTYLDSISAKIGEEGVAEGGKLAASYKPGNLRELLGLDVKVVEVASAAPPAENNALLPNLNPPVDGLEFHEAIAVPKNIGQSPAWQLPKRDLAPYANAPPLDAPAMPADLLAAYPATTAQFKPEDYTSLTPDQVMERLGNPPVLPQQDRNNSSAAYVGKDGNPFTGVMIRTRGSKILHGTVTTGKKVIVDITKILNGKKHGSSWNWSVFNPNAVTKCKVVSPALCGIYALNNYSEGKESGLQLEFNKKGELDTVQDYTGKDGKTHWSYIFERGALSGVYYYEGGRLSQKISISGKSIEVAKYDLSQQDNNSYQAVEYREGFMEYSSKKVNNKRDGNHLEYAHKQLKEWISYKDGEKNGPSREYAFSDDSVRYLRSERFFVNGKMDGPWWQFDKDGKVIFKMWKNGQLDGLFVEKHYEKGFFKAGKKEGPYLHFNYKGILSEINEYKNGEIDGKDLKFSDDGSRLEQYIEYKKGSINGRWIEYQLGSNGKNVSVSSKMYVNGIQQGMARKYYMNGKIKLESYYNTAGKLHGLRKAFHSDGTEEGETTYVDGVEKGPYRKFDGEGKLIKEGVH